MSKPVTIWLLIILVVLSTGCSTIVKPEQPVVLDSVVLNDSNSVGQSFIANFDGMNEIAIYLEPLEAGQGEIQLILREATQTPILGLTGLPLDQISAPGYYHFALPIQIDSNQQSFFLQLRIKGEGGLKIGTAPGEFYLDGALYQNGQADDHRQMAFQLGYYTPRLILGLGSETLLWGWYLLVSLFLFVLPGWALLDVLTSYPIKKKPAISDLTQYLHNPFIKLSISFGISLAFYPILLVWTDLFGLHLGLWYAWLPPIAAGVFLIWHTARRWKNGDIQIKFPTIQLVDAVLWIIILFIILTRFWVIRALPLPLWGDSYQHTMIAQLIIDNHGLFNSWQPYTDANTFTYHFGFHAMVSVFHWMTHIPVAQATLITGQIINILAVLVLYPLTMLLFQNKWSGIVALLVAGLISPMPMFYVNWGRYTQLGGQVFLLVAVWFTWIIFKAEKSSWRLLLPTWLMISSLAMTHYRVIVFYVIFILSYWILQLWKGRYKHLLINTFWISMGAGIIFLPWFVNVFGGRILRLFETLITQMPATGGSSIASEIAYSIGDLTTYLPMAVWITIILVLAICIWQKRMAVATVGLWWILLFLVANPNWIYLPGNGIIDNFAVFIATYIPAGLILAAIPAWFPRKPNHLYLKPIWSNIFLGILISGLGIWGAWQQHGMVLPSQYAIAVEPDIQAATWIKNNIPQDARFLVNSFFAYNDYVIVGSDGGWWLPLLANRQTNLPPITYVFESEPFPDYNQWIKEPTYMIQTAGLTHPETLAMLADRGITHVYIGQRQGRVNYAGPHILDPNQLMMDAHFIPLYHQDRVWIFEFRP